MFWRGGGVLVVVVVDLELELEVLGFLLEGRW
jgi:hypothetical protein